MINVQIDLEIKFLNYFKIDDLSPKSVLTEFDIIVL